MNAKERIAAVLHQARVNGGWIDEDVAAVILSDLSLDDNGKPIPVNPAGPEPREHQPLG